MVKYYGRARQRIGSVNTNQLGLKMSGCPSKIGRQGYISRYMGQRVNCMEGVCGYPKVNGAIWRNSYRNTRKFCKGPASKCSAAAGGIRTTYVPYYKSVAPGVQGCGIPYKNIKKLPSIVFKAGATTINGDPVVGFIVGGAAEVIGGGVVEPIGGLGVPEDSDGLVVVFTQNGGNDAILVTDNIKTDEIKKVEVEVNDRPVADAEVEIINEKTAKVPLSDSIKPGDKVAVTVETKDVTARPAESRGANPVIVQSSMLLL